MPRPPLYGLVGLAALVAGCVPLEQQAGYGGGALIREPSSGIYWSGPGASPYDRYAYGSPYGFPPYARPYGYPSYSRDYDDGRKFRPSRNVVCDRDTRTCYKGGDVDVSETKARFGRKAGREVDRLRDRYDTDDLYRPDDDVVCNRDSRVCYKDGHPDRSETRDYFGKKAAKKIKKKG